VTREHVVTVVVPNELVEAVAERVAELVRENGGDAGLGGSPWLDVKGAMAYLGFSRNKLYKLTAARAIPYRKKRGGQGLLFHRDELDEWLKTRYTRQS